MKEVISSTTGGMRRMAAALTLMLALGFAGTASAQNGFTVVYDCHGNGGNPAWATTNDTIYVMVKVNGKWITMRAGRVTDCRSDRTNAVYLDAFYATDIEQIGIVTFGNDAFWLDDLEIWSGARSELEWSWGIDNNRGACISAQASDGNSSYCYDGKAHQSFVKDVEILPSLVPFR
jgi:hypothetical protein